jgi:transcriptional regulator with XRE-family HTH domain
MEEIAMPRHNHRDPDSDLSAGLGEELRLLRVAAGYPTQEAFAKALNFGREQVSKVETGYEVPSENLFWRWLDLCQASDEARHYLERMLRQARKARVAAPAFAKPWLEAESQAEYLLIWTPGIVPGLLQVRSYAITLFIEAGFHEDEAIVKAEERLERQSILARDDPDPVHMTAVVHESVLNQEVGSPEVMVPQLEHLLKMSEKPNVIIQVVKVGKYFFGKEGHFEIATGESIPDTLVMVASVEDQNSQIKAVVSAAIKLFKRIQGRALNVEDSRVLIREALQRWKSKLEQQ